MDEAASDTSTSHPYDEFLKDRITAEETRKASLEQRGIAVISTSGTLVTLLFGLAALLTSRQNYTPPTDFRILIACALGFFLLATVVAIFTNIPLPYSEIEADKLSADELWREDSQQAKQKIFGFRVTVLQGLQKRNGVKALCVVVAMGLQGIAAFFVALTVWSILQAN